MFRDRRIGEKVELRALPHGCGVDHGAQTDVLAVGLPPTDLATTARVKSELSLVHRHIDDNEVRDGAERTDHGERTSYDAQPLNLQGPQRLTSMHRSRGGGP